MHRAAGNVLQPCTCKEGKAWNGAAQQTVMLPGKGPVVSAEQGSGPLGAGQQGLRTRAFLRTLPQVDSGELVSPRWLQRRLCLPEK